MKKRIDPYILLLALGAVLIGIFYLKYVNLSTDTIILFLSQKIFLGKWLARGIVPFFNPLLYAGIPFLFDPGMGHLHPFNVFFLIPYPYSFAVWTAFTVFLFLGGFYLLFSTFSKDRLVNFTMVLVLFFSGSGFWRTNNPAISLVIAHYGLFFYSMVFLKKRNISPLMLVSGFFMTLSGHIQFVFYGYIIGFLVGWLFYKISLKRLFLNFILLALLTSWFYVLCLPIVLSSTRLTTDKDYTNMGPLNPLQLIQFIFPLFFGFVRNGSKWNAGPTFVTLVSVLFAPALAYLAVKRKIGWGVLAVFAVFAGATLGIVNFPFFRGAAQSIIVIHILGLILIVQNWRFLTDAVRRINPAYMIAGFVSSLLAFIFFITPLFSTMFSLLYHAVKKTPSLFYDQATVSAIGKIIGLNFVPLMVLSLALYFAIRYSRMLPYFILAFVVFEGIFVNYYHNYFVPQSVLTSQKTLPSLIDTKDYRVQTGADVIPYFGFHNYISEVLFRPPFSKEPTSFDQKEQHSFARLSAIFSYYPSSWAMTGSIKALQGYNTFVTGRIAQYFKQPSSDYRQVYDYIIRRNSLYGQSEKGLDINGIETSKVTLYDPRWQELGVRYFISDRPLARYKLVATDGGRLFYENPATLPIFRLEDGTSVVGKTPVYEDPNRMVFDMTKRDVGKKLVIVINPDGFEARQNGMVLPSVKNGFRLEIPVQKTGALTVSYSPLLHLMETVKSFFRR